MPLIEGLRQPIPRRKLAKGEALPDFAKASDPANANADMWEGVPDPRNPARIVLKNINRAGVGDGHATMTTGRELPKGSTSHVTTGFLYLLPADLKQTGRNLILQLQMKGSPIVAISTLNGNWTVVDRINGTMSRKTLGPIAWGKWTYFDVAVKLADSGGFVKVWWAVDRLPELALAPVLSKSGDTWQGETGHHTIGQYSGHSDPDGEYTGYVDVFGRGTTAQEARAKAGPIAPASTPEPTPDPDPDPDPEPEPEPEPEPTGPTQAEARAALEVLRRYVG